MHIRNPRTHELVKEIAELTGTTQEDAALSAAEHYLRVLRATTRAQQITDEGRAIGKLVGLVPGEDPTADLYDESGLPS